MFKNQAFCKSYKRWSCFVMVRKAGVVPEGGEENELEGEAEKGEEKGRMLQ